MQILNNEEMLKVEGGSITGGLVTGIVSGIITFLIGFLDGYSNPPACKR